MWILEWAAAFSVGGFCFVFGGMIAWIMGGRLFNRWL